MEKQKFHFEPPKGWMNDPNGLCFFNGKYHIFYQHNPHSLEWDTMHWGHTTTTDFIHYDDLPIALYPDMPYENGGGCFSGSAVVKDGILYLFYTTPSRELGQTQSIATSKDGVHFEKHPSNPIITTPPEGATSVDFRDPKVTFFDGCYHMVCAGGKNEVGGVYHYTSNDLINWVNRPILVSGSEYGPVLECPDFFKMGNDYFLSFSMLRGNPYRVTTLVGDFDGEVFTPRQRFDTESGPDYYAPQSFEAPDGRRISFGWMTTGRDGMVRSNVRTGGLTVPREVTYENGVLRHYPVAEVRHLIKNEDPHVKINGNKVTIVDGDTVIGDREYPNVDTVEIIADDNVVEVFINKGEFTCTAWVH